MYFLKKEQLLTTIIERQWDPVNLFSCNNDRYLPSPSNVTP